MCFQLTHFPCDDWENIYTLSYYHHQIGSMNYYPLLRVRSWSDGVRCMSFCIIYLTLPDFTLPYLNLPYLTSPHLISSHLISSVHLICWHPIFKWAVVSWRGFMGAWIARFMGPRWATWTLLSGFLDSSPTNGCSASCCHYNDVIMGVIASQITRLTIVYSTDYSGADQRKHQSFALLAFVRGIHRGPVNSPHKGQWRGKCFHLMTSSWFCI